MIERETTQYQVFAACSSVAFILCTCLYCAVWQSSRIVICFCWWPVLWFLLI